MQNLEKITSRICLSSDVGAYGNMFGGKLLALMDEAAAIYAAQYTGCRRIVSRKFSEVEFHAPVKEGEILEFYAGNPRRGTTSIAFDVLVKVGEHKRFEASCVFVAVDAEGRKTPIDWTKAPGFRQ